MNLAEAKIALQLSEYFSKFFAILSPNFVPINKGILKVVWGRAYRKNVWLSVSSWQSKWDIGLHSLHDYNYNLGREGGRERGREGGREKGEGERRGREGEEGGK